MRCAGITLTRADRPRDTSGALVGDDYKSKWRQHKKMDQQAKFEGWAVVELFGHSKEAGYVTTQYFGDRAMFQIDVPTFEDREYELERPEWCEVDGRDQLVPKGSKVLRKGTPARSRIVSPGAVYAMNP